MNKDLLARVGAIAARARKWTEIRADRAGDDETNGLCGWCAISAAYLFRELSNAGIKVELHLADGHCFTVVDDHIVDVTATQFDEFRNTKINILHVKEAADFWYYETVKTFDNPTALRDHQLKKKWPKNQIAYTR